MEIKSLIERIEKSEGADCAEMIGKLASLILGLAPRAGLYVEISINPRALKARSQSHEG